MQEVSLHDTVRSQVGSFMQSFMFICSTTESNNAFCDGMVEVIDMLSDYYEEGTHLYPSIVLFDDPQYLRILPNIHYTFYQGAIELKQFKQCLKMCAPLAVNGWNIFMQVRDTSMSWGVITTELKETSLSLTSQILREKEEFCKVALITNVGMKTVAMASSGRECECIVHLSLMNNHAVTSKDIDDFCSCALHNCQVHTEEFKGYFSKIIGTALQTGHGNLFGIIEERDEMQIPNLLKDGVSLIEEPLDFASVYSQLNSDVNTGNTVELNSMLKMMSALAISMMNHDGITVFTDTGKIVGYHFIVDNNVSPKDMIVGGARTKAFYAMVESGLFKGVFIRKQEGETIFK